MAETAQNQRSVANNIKAQFGQAAPAEREQTSAASTTIDYFRSDAAYIALKADPKLDEGGKVVDEKLRIVASFGGHYVSLPINGNWWKEFANFANEMANILDGVAVESINTNCDMEAARRVMSRYRKA